MIANPTVGEIVKFSRTAPNGVVAVVEAKVTEICGPFVEGGVIDLTVVELCGLRSWVNAKKADAVEATEPAP